MNTTIYAIIFSLFTSIIFELVVGLKIFETNKKIDLKKSRRKKRLIENELLLCESKRLTPSNKTDIKINLNNEANTISSDIYKNYICCYTGKNCFNKKTDNFVEINHEPCIKIDRDLIFGRAEKNPNHNLNTRILIENDKFISRIHFEIDVDEKNIILRDCHSTNGTFLNGQRLDSEALLSPGDIIEVGETKLIFKTIEQNTSE